MAPQERLRRFQIPVPWILAAFFFMAELGSYLAGVVSSSILVKRVGPQALPWTYLGINVLFLPILVGVALSPPRSSHRLVKLTLSGYLLALAVLMVGSTTSSAAALGTLCVVARVGKFLWGIFAVGMVSEVLPLRETKTIGPRIMAASASGMAVGGVLLKSLVTWLGPTGTLICVWLVLAGALAVLACVPVVEERPLEGADGSGPAPASTVFETMRGLLVSPLARLVGTMELLMVAHRNLTDFVYTRALSQGFPSEEAMLGFCGTLEATMMVATIATQLSISGALMQWLRVGAVAHLFPAVLGVAGSIAFLSPSLFTQLAVMFTFAVALECFYKPVRQLLVAAAGREARQRTLVAVALMGGAGSLISSVLLMSMNRWAGPSAPLMAIVGIGVLHLWVARSVGRTYLASLTGLVAEGPTEPTGPLSFDLQLSDAEQREVMVRALLEAPQAGDRRRGVELLARLDRTTAIANAVRLLEGETDPMVKSHALSVLSTLRPEGIEELLFRLANDESSRVRANALEALGRCGSGPRTVDLLLERTASPEVRERGAAVLALLELKVEENVIPQAVDGLACMVESADTPSVRSAGTEIMGRLGFSFFQADLEALLEDPEAAVRVRAGRALVALHCPASMGAVQAALEREPDAATRESLSRCVDELRAGTFDSLVQVVDSLTLAERSRAVAVLSTCRGDPRLPLMGKILSMEGVLRPADLMATLTSLEVGDTLAALAACLDAPEPPATVDGTARSTGQLRLAPMLEHLRRGGSRGGATGYTILGHLRDLMEIPVLQAHLEETARALWIFTAVEQLLALAPTPDIVAALSRARRLRDERLHHFLALVALFSSDPPMTVRILRAALSGDPQLSSIGMEILDECLPAAVRQVAHDLLIEYPDTTLRRRRAGERANLVEGTPVATVLEVLDREESPCVSF